MSTRSHDTGVPRRETGRRPVKVLSLCVVMAVSQIKHCLFSRSTRWVVLVGLLLSLVVTYVTDIWRIQVIFDQQGNRMISLGGTVTKSDNKLHSISDLVTQPNVLHPTPTKVEFKNVTLTNFTISDNEWDEDKLRREASKRKPVNDNYSFLDEIIAKIAPTRNKSGVASKTPPDNSNKTSITTTTNQKNKSHIALKTSPDNSPPKKTATSDQKNNLDGQGKFQPSNKSKAVLPPDVQKTVSNLPMFRAEGVNCAGLIAGNNASMAAGAKYLRKNPKVIIPDYHYITAAKKCDKFKQERHYISKPLSKEEEEFPIAYSILIFKDIEQFERLLRAIYHPQNYYCVHVDIKSEEDVKKAAQAITSCFDNVFLSSKSFDVEWGAFSVLEPELMCMEDLWKYKKWKYFINLTGQEFPLKTNLDIVKILKVYNGANNMEGTKKRRNVERTVYVHNGFYSTEEKLGPMPINVTITKGSVHVTASRAFVDVVLHDSRLLKFREWVKDTGVPDETFFSSINHSPHLGIPGAYKGDPETDTSKYLFITRYKNWGVYPFNYPCGGQRVRMICVFAMRDLPILAERKELFANKFYLDYSPVTLDCMEELHFNRTRDEVLGKRDFDTTFYKGLDFVKNHV